MEVQVDFLGMDTAMKLVPIWHLFSQAGFYAVSQFFIVRVGHYLYTLFEQTVPFCIHITCMIVVLFIIAKGLAMRRLGEVISTQIVLF